MSKIHFNGVKVIGKFVNEFNEILGVHYPVMPICYTKGLEAHIKKQKHYNVLKYLDRISDIIGTPDYIGINPHEYGNDTIEIVKKFEEYVMIGIKLDASKEYYYITTMYTIHSAKIRRRFYSDRLKRVDFSALKMNGKRNHYFIDEKHIFSE